MFVRCRHWHGRFIRGLLAGPAAYRGALQDRFDRPVEAFALEQKIPEKKQAIRPSQSTIMVAGSFRSPDLYASVTMTIGTDLYRVSFMIACAISMLGWSDEHRSIRIMSGSH